MLIVGRAIVATTECGSHGASEVGYNGVGVTIPVSGEAAAFLDTVSGAVHLVAEVDASTGNVTIHE